MLKWLPKMGCYYLPVTQEVGLKFSWTQKGLHLDIELDDGKVLPRHRPRQDIYDHLAVQMRDTVFGVHTFTCQKFNFCSGSLDKQTLPHSVLSLHSNVIAPPVT